MANEITFGWKSDESLTFAVFTDAGSQRETGTTMTETPVSSGLYLGTPTAISNGDLVVIDDGTYKVGYGQYQPEVDTVKVSGTAQTANDNGADINAILADTDTMEADLKTHIDSAEADLTTEIDANETKIDTAISNIATVNGIVDDILVDTGTTIPATITTAQNDLDIITGTSGALIDTDAVDADAIKADAVTEIQSGMATETKQDTIDGIVDNILTDTGTTIPNQITALNNFDPDNDDVAKVTLVATTTTNTDMRGTDDANTTKTGFKLASDGLDSIAITEPSGVASNFREMIVQLWRRFHNKSKMTADKLTVYKDDGTTAATEQTLAETDDEQNMSAAS